jgi:PII-like signaling protein
MKPIEYKRPLEYKKLLTIIAARELEKMIIEAARRRGVGGYTVVQASGAGASGIQSGMLDSDSNILIYIILSEARLLSVLEDLDEMIRRGHRLKAIVSDIAILPRKPAGGSLG